MAEIAPRGATGWGPGVITPDGCSVELYALLAPGPELDVIRQEAAPGSSILELGSGAGRLTRPLVGCGYEVVAVDESAEMLAKITCAETVLSPIETLRLGRTFDVVLLASFLLNTMSIELRSAMIAAAARHLDKAGVMLIQRHAPSWFATVSERDHQDGEMTTRLHHIRHPASDLLSATVTYAVGDRLWGQEFTARCVTNADLDAAAQEHGLVVDGYADADQTWARVRVPVR